MFPINLLILSKDKMKKIFLIWDIGTWKDWFYHIWDEAMFRYNYSYLNKHWYDLYLSSRGIKTNYKNQISDINFQSKFKIIKLFLLIFFYYFFNRNSKIIKIIETIKKVDIIIISWWWNLNSIWNWHLYYRFLITYFSKRFSKKVFLSWQTIWPIKWFIDNFLINYILNYVKIIWLRDLSFSKKYIKDKYYDKIRYYYDDVFLSKNKLSINFQLNSYFYYVWLSLHNGENKKKLIKTLKQLINWINNKYKNVKYVIIPHVFDNKLWYDIDFMKNFEDINYEIIDFKKFNLPYEEVIEEITRKMNKIITTRYHWWVFSLKHNISSIMIWRNDYEIWKFKWLEEITDTKLNIIDIRKTNKYNIDNIISSHIKKVNIDFKKCFIYNFIKKYDKIK